MSISASSSKTSVDHVGQHWACGQAWLPHEKLTHIQVNSRTFLGQETVGLWIWGAGANRELLHKGTQLPSPSSHLKCLLITEKALILFCLEITQVIIMNLPATLALSHLNKKTQSPGLLILYPVSRQRIVVNESNGNDSLYKSEFKWIMPLLFYTFLKNNK